MEARELGINKVLVALSGGADSVATAFALKQADIEIMALHCNFHLRGEESDRDMEFVSNFCLSHSIPLKTKDFDVEEFRKNHKGVSIEMACRDLRYRWFDEMLQETGYQRIATGHNADDNIETFLLNMLRGAGSRGLKGMSRDTGTIWRPLLEYHRNDILLYLNHYKLDFVTDSSNLESDYRRNFLRNKVIPLIKEEWKGFDKAMDHTIQNINAENLLVENILSSSLPKRMEPLSIDIILASPAPLLLIKRFIDPLGPYSSTPREILSAIKAQKPHIRRWQLRKGSVALRNRSLYIFK